jgi:inner membrane protein
MKNTLLPKLLTLAALVILLAVFLHMIQGIIAERQRYRQEALSSVSQSVAGAQTLLGPVLHMSCTERWDKRAKDGTSAEEKREFILTSTPQTLNVQSQVTVEARSRSIYQAQVMNTKAVLKAKFDPSDMLKPKSSVTGSRMQCDAPILMLALDDPRGIRHASALFNGQDHKLKAGTFHPTYKRGMHAALPPTALTALAASTEGWSAELAVEFVGTQQLGIVPLGETTTIKMSSNWPHPSFTGRFAPSERNISPGQGFTAEWRLNSVATNASELVSQAMPLCDRHVEQGKDCAESVQVGFVEPVNAYSLSDRASKYGLLFVVLTFVAVGLFEVMKKLRVHPVQYLLAGAAISTFFLLLVSLSEHIGFARAYAAGASATVLLLTYYASYMLGGKWRGLPFGAGIALLYAFMYVLLQLEQTALAMGSVMLFIALAIVMTLTRKINWYEQFSAKPAPTVAPEAT